MATPEAVGNPDQLPTIHYDESATDEQKQALETFVQLALISDELAVAQGMELHDANPDFVRKVVDYLGQHTVGQEVLASWRDVVATKPELDLNFDDGTKHHLETDPEHIKLVGRVQKPTHGEVERAKAAVRRSMFLTFAKRLRVFKEGEVAA